MAKQIQKKNFDITPLLSAGIIARISIGRWRAEAPILPEDLGLSRTTFVDDFLQLGRKTLIPPQAQKKMNSIEHAARTAFKKFVFDTPFGFFVPAGAYERLEDEMEARRGDWFEERDALLRHLDKHGDEVKAAYRDFAKQIYERAKAKGSIESYARQVAQSVIEAIPTKTEIAGSFYFDLQVFQPVTTISAAAKKTLLKDDKSQRILAMNERLTAKWEREKSEKVDSFVNTILRQLREMVFETTSNAVRKMKDSTNIHKSSKTALKALIDRYRMMNFLGDSEIDKELAALDQQLETSDNRSVEEIVEQLEVLRTMSRKALLDLGVSSREVRRIELGRQEMEETAAINRKARSGALVAA